MNVLQRKRIRLTFLCIKADRDALYRTDIINGTFLIKISQRDMAVLLINFDRCDRGWDFLDQCQMIFPVTFIGSVDKFLQCGATQSAGVPGWHYSTPRCSSSGSS